MHLVGCATVGIGGQILHTYRRHENAAANATTWTPFINIENEALGGADRGLFNVGDVACALNGVPSSPGDLDVCVVNNIGEVWHSVRKWNFNAPDTVAQWDALGDVVQQSGDVGAHSRISCCLDRVEGLHVVSSTKDGNVWHTIRRFDGTWVPFGSVKGQAGDPGNVVDVACAWDWNELHVCVVTQGGDISHTIRRADGSWFPFGIVQQQSGHVLPNTNIALQGRTVSCWAEDGRLFLWVVTTDGKMLSTIRWSDGGWMPWSRETSWFSGTPVDIGVSGFSGLGGAGTHVAVVTNTGGLFHQMLGVGSGNVQNQAGQVGAFRSVALAGV